VTRRQRGENRATTSGARARWTTTLLAATASPAEKHGIVLAFMGTTASMVAVINNVVAGAALALALHMLLPSMPTWADVVTGGARVQPHETTGSARSPTVRTALRPLGRQYQPWGLP
jgi:hypothetical protein